MNKTCLALLATVFAAGSVLAETETDNLGVTTSTDPAKVAEVERHAQELQQGQAMSTSGTQATSGAKKAKKASKTKRASASKGTSGSKATGGTKSQ